MSPFFFVVALLVSQSGTPSHVGPIAGIKGVVLRQDRQRSPASPFNGTWVMTFQPREKAQPEVISLVSGVFSRGDAEAKISVMADGHTHSVKDDGYVDSIRIAASGFFEIRELDYFKGRLAYSVNYRASPDGSTLTKTIVNYSKPDRRPITSTVISRRAGGPRASGSAVSGTWRLVGMEATRSHRTEKIVLRGSRFSSLTPGNSGFDAVIGGAPVPIRGDATDARIAISMPNERLVLMEMSRNGRPTVHKTMTISPDHRTIAVSAQRVSDGVNTEWTLRRQ